jgi:ribose 5-phosphate isomerase A
MIKGSGAAQTRIKIIATASKQFVCLVDASKLVAWFRVFPLPVEIIPMARRVISEVIASRGGNVRLRNGVVTDNGNEILDVEGLDYADPTEFESRLNQLPGVVGNGVFAQRMADICVVVGDQITVQH